MQEAVQQNIQILSINRWNFYTTGFFTSRNSCVIVAAEIKGNARKGKDMITVRFVMSYKVKIENLSSVEYLDSLFARSYKAEKNRKRIS